MADFRPFRALRYNLDVAGDADDLIAPPYDIVSDADKQELYARSPYNVARIDYGEERPDDSPAGNRYSRARALLHEWREEGVLAVDGTPRLYAYDQEFDLHGRRLLRRSVFGALRLEEWEKGIILPHEVTGASAKADRLRLLQATHVHMSPVMAMYEPGGVPPVTDADLEAPVIEATLNGEQHVLRPLREDAAEAFARAMAGQRLFIADGHHRYETGLTYRDERRANARSWTGKEAENFIVAALVSTEDPGLVVLPTHRMVNLPDPSIDAEARTRDLFDVIQVGSPEGLRAELADIDERRQAFGIVGPRSATFWLAVTKDLEAAAAKTPQDHTDAWRRLDVTVLHHTLLASLGFEETLENIAYTDDAEEAVQGVLAGRWDAAFLMNATPVSQVIAVAGQNDRMPRKSTFFYPKLGTGLVMLALD
jgi:uncharacterized protein (DUF1015 family)